MLIKSARSFRETQSLHVFLKWIGNLLGIKFITRDFKLVANYFCLLRLHLIPIFIKLLHTLSSTLTSQEYEDIPNHNINFSRIEGHTKPPWFYLFVVPCTHPRSLKSTLIQCPYTYNATNNVHIRLQLSGSLDYS